MPGCNLPPVQEALKLLGIDNFLLGIHDAAFPGSRDEDLGCGTPYSRGGRQFLEFAGELGFNGVQLGPQGITTAVNQSPYDGTQFSRNPLLLAPLQFAGSRWQLLDLQKLAGVIAQRPPDLGRAQLDFSEMASRRIGETACRRFREICRAPAFRPGILSLRQSFALFRQRNADWLLRDALFEVLKLNYGGRGWRYWGDSEEARLDQTLFAPPAGAEDVAARRIRFLQDKHREAIDNYCFVQFLLSRQHRELRRHCRRLGLRLFGDCQIGMSERDAWFAQSFLLSGYFMGAPPSRTNPEGQPWSYPVLDPQRYLADGVDGPRHLGPAALYFRRRLDRLLADFDGLRIDHPHGLICPWVYRADQGDPLQAVQQGARLFSSPALPDHPELAAYAIVRADQLNGRRARFADDWVTDLDPDQVRRYAFLFEEIMAAARRNGRGSGDVACEILSTQPYPLQQVMAHYGQGRFRVTQKANLKDPGDVYRSENARPEDWLMLGNHDTEPIWVVARGWLETGESRRQAAYLAERLRIPEEERPNWENRVAGDRGLLVAAKFADLFAGPARNVMVYFTDLLGLEEPYNRPGTISAANWSLRIAPAYRDHYREKQRGNLVLTIPRALALALRARGAAFAARHAGLISTLEQSTIS